MSDFKAFYFNLDQNNQSFVGKLLNQYEKVEWEQLAKFEDLFDSAINSKVDFLLLDSGTSATELASLMSKSNNALLNTKLMWITNDSIQKSHFDDSLVKKFFKNVDHLPANNSLLRKISIIHDFITLNTEVRVNKEDFYIPLDFIYFVKLTQSPCDIFIKISQKKYIKIINKEDDFKIKEIFDKYADKNIKEFYITYNNLVKFRDYFFRTIFQNDSGSASVITHQLQVSESVLTVARDFGISEFVIEGINSSLGEISKEFDSLDKLQGFLDKILTMQGSLISNHSYLTALFLSLIGKSVPWFTLEVKKNLLTAAMLHDLDIHGTGLEEFEFKSVHEINALNPIEREIVKTHSTALTKRLEKNDSIPTEVINIIAKHHEGSGPLSYPQGLHASQLSLPNCLFNVAHQFAIELANVGYNYDKFDQILATLNNYYSGNSFKQFIDILEQEIARK